MVKSHGPYGVLIVVLAYLDIFQDGVENYINTYLVTFLAQGEDDTDQSL